MERLSHHCRRELAAAILDRFDVVYVAGVQAHNIISVGITIGSPLSGRLHGHRARAAGRSA